MTWKGGPENGSVEHTFVVWPSYIVARCFGSLGLL